MATAHDHAEVTRDDRTFQQFLAARAAGDAAGMRVAWENLVVENYGRVRTIVIATSRGQLSASEQEDAVQQACIKLLNNMIRTFSGTSTGEWVNATRTLVRGVCIDVQRAEQRHSEKRAPLHADDDGDETERLTLRVFHALEQADAARAADEDERDALAEKAGFLDWALPQLAEKRRLVIELDRQEVPTAEIEERLGMSSDAVYANRSRGLSDLARLAKEYAP
ncbi:MAG: RNA polymerase sigma factor [Solirubrobacteraceae bacterium]